MDFNVDKSTNSENIVASEGLQQEEKKVKWCDPNEDAKYVCQGGKVQCKYCSNPIASLIVTAEMVMLQDKPWATVGDNDGKVNFGFTGICTHPQWGNQKPLCKTVISLGQWKNFSETFIGNYNALLVRSSIPCMVSGEDLKIVHSGQTATLEVVNPLDFSKTILDAYWIDKELQVRRDLTYGISVELHIEVRGIKKGEIMTFLINHFNNEQNIFVGKALEDGLVVVQNFKID